MDYSSSDEEDTKLRTLNSKGLLAQSILDVFMKSASTKEQQDQPISKSQKMQNQTKIDKINDILAAFDKALNCHETALKKEVEKIDREDTNCQRRKETTTKMITELEKRLFDSERERVILRREREDLQRDIKAT